MDTGRSDKAKANLLWFGQRVRSLRASADLSQEKLSEASGVHRTVVGLIERGERDIGITQLWPLANALGVTIAELFDGEAA